MISLLVMDEKQHALTKWRVVALLAVQRLAAEDVVAAENVDEVKCLFAVALPSDLATSHVLFADWTTVVDVVVVVRKMASLASVKIVVSVAVHSQQA